MTTSRAAIETRAQRQLCPRRANGFTLVELVSVIIIVGVLAAIAVPRFVSLGTSARIAAVHTMAGVLRSTGENMRVTCKLYVACDGNSTVSMNGVNAAFSLGYLEAGDCLNCSQIDSWVMYTGFTPVLIPNMRTHFTLDGAPDPANCSATYVDQFGYYDGTLHIEVATSGC